MRFSFWVFETCLRWVYSMLMKNSDRAREPWPGLVNLARKWLRLIISSDITRINHVLQSLASCTIYFSPEENSAGHWTFTSPWINFKTLQILKTCWPKLSLLITWKTRKYHAAKVTFFRDVTDRPRHLRLWKCSLSLNSFVCCVITQLS